MTVQVLGLSGFVRHVGNATAGAKKLDETVVTALAIKAKATVLAEAGAAVPGRRLSRFADGKGITLNARFLVKPGDPASAVLYPTPPGPWYLLEGGGKAHQIGRRGTRRGARRNQPGFLGNPATGFAAVGPVNHPPAEARHTWTKASAIAISQGSAAFASVHRHAYVKLFTG